VWRASSAAKRSSRLGSALVGGRCRRSSARWPTGRCQGFRCSCSWWSAGDWADMGLLPGLQEGHRHRGWRSSAASPPPRPTGGGRAWSAGPGSAPVRAPPPCDGARRPGDGPPGSRRSLRTASGPPAPGRAWHSARARPPPGCHLARSLAQRDPVADAHLARGLGVLAIDLDAAVSGLLGRQGACLVRAVRPRAICRGGRAGCRSCGLRGRQRQPDDGIDAVDAAGVGAVLQARSGRRGWRRSRGRWPGPAPSPPRRPSRVRRAGTGAGCRSGGMPVP
jgi:hypothetical protein